MFNFSKKNKGKTPSKDHNTVDPEKFRNTLIEKFAAMKTAEEGLGYLVNHSWFAAKSVLAGNETVANSRTGHSAALHFYHALLSYARVVENKNSLVLIEYQLQHAGQAQHLASEQKLPELDKDALKLADQIVKMGYLIFDKSDALQDMSNHLMENFLSASKKAVDPADRFYDMSDRENLMLAEDFSQIMHGWLSQNVDLAQQTGPGDFSVQIEYDLQAREKVTLKLHDQVIFVQFHNAPDNQPGGSSMPPPQPSL